MYYVSEKFTVYQTLTYSENILLLFWNMLPKMLAIMLWSIRPFIHDY